MKVYDPSQNRSTFVRKILLGFGGVIVVASSCTVAAAQSLSPRPVARLITGTTSDSKVGRTDSAEAGRVAAAPLSPSLAEATESERRAFDVTNELRSKNGLAPLEWDAELCMIARRHSRNMSTLGFFSHQTPEGLRLRDRARLAGIRYHVIAENIAYNQGIEDPGAFAVERWMISPGHRANLLSSEFRGAAVGSFVAADGRVYLTQLFILR